ncbi:MAG TPA: DinB family protein [Virgibacillus sp.]|nr:DinB family protein [Virgibacillus sp.]
MTHETVTAMWNSVRSRFTRKVNTLTHEDLNRQLGETTVADLLYHTGEAEYIFMEWYFNKEMPDFEKPHTTDREALITFLETSNAHVTDAIQTLPENEWDKVRESQMGSSTPLEAISRLMYHAGIHAGQITDILNHGHMKNTDRH